MRSANVSAGPVPLSHRSTPSPKVPEKVDVLQMGVEEETEESVLQKSLMHLMTPNPNRNFYSTTCFTGFRVKFWTQLKLWRGGGGLKPSLCVTHQAVRDWNALNHPLPWFRLVSPLVSVLPCVYSTLVQGPLSTTSRALLSTVLLAVFNWPALLANRTFGGCSA